MSKTIKIAESLSLPLDAITNTFAVFGIRGAGKSNIGAVMAEGIIKAGQPVCIIDPTGAWYGLKSSADGRGPGLSIYVFGGEHADIPLEPTAGEVLANFVVERRVPVVLDLKLMRKHEQIRFMVAFAETLFHRNREPLMVFIDEAARFAPQAIKDKAPEAARCLGAMEDLATLGRSRGLGVTLMAQRPAPVSTTLRTQIENLICLRTIGKHDRRAIDEWVEAKGTQQERDQMMKDLAELPDGVGYFWSPGWLHKFTKVHFNRRETFDSGRTPKIGEKILTPRAFAEIDRDQLSAEIKSTIERAKAEDPRELKKQLGFVRQELELEKKKLRLLSEEKGHLAGTGGGKAHYADIRQKGIEAGIEQARREYAKLTAKFRKEMAVLARENKRLFEQLQRELLLATEHLGFAAQAHNKLGEQAARTAGLWESSFNANTLEIPAEMPDSFTKPAPEAPKLGTSKRRFPAPNGAPGGKDSLPTPDGEIKIDRLRRAILIALAQHPEGLAKNLILLHTGYRSSGDVSTSFAELGRYGLVESASSGLRITEAGLKALGDYDPLPVGADLRDWLLTGDKLSKVEKALLQVICGAYPAEVAKGEIVRQAGYKPSGDISTAFARLTRFGYVIKSGGGLKLARELTDEVGYGAA